MIDHATEPATEQSTPEPIATMDVPQLEADYRSAIHLFDSEKWRLLQVVRSFGFTWSQSARNPMTREARRFRGSGTWSWYAQPGAVTFSWDMGCWCEHDCCGCCCGHGLQFIQAGPYWVVRESWSFNY